MSSTTFAEGSRDLLERIIGNNAPEGIPNYSKIALDIMEALVIRSVGEFKSAQPEVVIPHLANVLTAWSCWILEAKSICHYRRSGRETGYRPMRDAYLTQLKKLIVDARNLAADEKRSKKAKGDTGLDSDIPPTIALPSQYSAETCFDTTQP